MLIYHSYVLHYSIQPAERISKSVINALHLPTKRPILKLPMFTAYLSRNRITLSTVTCPHAKPSLGLRSEGSHLATFPVGSEEGRIGTLWSHNFPTIFILRTLEWPVQLIPREVPGEVKSTWFNLVGR